MREIVERLHENRRIEIAKEILKSKGYTIQEAKHLFESNETYYKDEQGIFGTPGEIMSFSDINKYWDDNCCNDPCLEDYANFNDWWKDTEPYLTEIDEEDISESSTSQQVSPASLHPGQKVIDKSDTSNKVLTVKNVSPLKGRKDITVVTFEDGTTGNYDSNDKFEIAKED